MSESEIEAVLFVHCLFRFFFFLLKGQFLNQTIYMFLDVWEMQFRGKGKHFVPLLDSSP